MWKDLLFFSLIFGDLFGKHDSDRVEPEISSEDILEHEQVKVLIDIVETANKIEKQNPSPEMLSIQLKPLKMMFDRINLKAIKSSAGITVYHQVEEYFNEHLRR